MPREKHSGKNTGTSGGDGDRTVEIGSPEWLQANRCHAMTGVGRCYLLGTKSPNLHSGKEKEPLSPWYCAFHYDAMVQGRFRAHYRREFEAFIEEARALDRRKDTTWSKHSEEILWRAVSGVEPLPTPRQEQAHDAYGDRMAPPWLVRQTFGDILAGLRGQMTFDTVRANLAHRRQAPPDRKSVAAEPALESADGGVPEWEDVD